MTLCSLTQTLKSSIKTVFHLQLVHCQEVSGGKKSALSCQTSVTNDITSFTLSCLTKTNTHSKPHPSVLVLNNDRLPLPLYPQHLDRLSVPLFSVLYGKQAEQQLGDGNLQVNQLLVRSYCCALYPTICKLIFIYYANFPKGNSLSISTQGISSFLRTD